MDTKHLSVACASVSKVERASLLVLTGLMKPSARVLIGEASQVLQTLPSESVHCIVTSPPYFRLRDYGHPDQLGLEGSIQEYVNALVRVMRGVRRVMRSDGTLWLVLGDSYASAKGAPTAVQRNNQMMGSPIVPPASRSGLKQKDLCGAPWRVALAMQADGWYLRSDIVWQKSNALPESVTDRCSRSHEYIFMLTKSPRYWFDAHAIKVVALSAGRARPTPWDTRRTIGHSFGRPPKSISLRNKRTVWTTAISRYKGDHFSTFPEELIEPCILAGCPQSGTVLDPFVGSGTTLAVAVKHGRNAVGIEVNPDCQLFIEGRLAPYTCEFTVERSKRPQSAA